MNVFFFCPQVVLFINAAGVDERRLKKFLSEGFEIEYHGRKVLKTKAFGNEPLHNIN